MITTVLTVAVWEAITSPSDARASDEQTAQFLELLKRAQRIQFDAIVTGDHSLFPSVYYNDSELPVQDPQSLEVVDWVGQEAVDAAIANAGPGPVGEGVGDLSFRIAGNINIWENIRAWEAIAAAAAAEGRQPTAEEVATMPHGQNPYPRKSEADWIDVPFALFDVMVDDDRATATLAFMSAEDVEAAKGEWLEYYHAGGGYYENVYFTLVEGQWYISGVQRVYWPFTDDAPKIGP